MSPGEISSREERILDAAAALIDHYGYDKTTVSDIAREAGVSKGAVYLHWPSKDALFADLLIREMKRLMLDVEARVDADPEGGTIAAIYSHSLMALLVNPFMRALYTRDSRVLGDYVRRQNASRYSQRYLFGQEFVQQMQSAGLLREDVSTRAITFVLSIVSYGLLNIHSIVPPEESPPLEEVASTLADVVRRAFARETGGESDAGKRALHELLDKVRRQYEMDGGACSSRADASRKGG